MRGCIAEESNGCSHDGASAPRPWPPHLHRAATRCRSSPCSARDSAGSLTDDLSPDEASRRSGSELGVGWGWEKSGGLARASRCCEHNSARARVRAKPVWLQGVLHPRTEQHDAMRRGSPLLDPSRGDGGSWCGARNGLQGHGKWGNRENQGERRTRITSVGDDGNWGDGNDKSSDEGLCGSCRLAQRLPSGQCDCSMESIGACSRDVNSTNPRTTEGCACSRYGTCDNSPSVGATGKRKH